MPFIKRLLPYALVFILGFIAWHKVTRWWNGPDAPRQVTETVISVDSGTQLTVRAGILGRRNRTVTLYGIAVPTGYEQQAKDLMSASVIAGDAVSLEVITGRRREDVSAVVYSDAGLNLNLEQLRKGVATNSCDRKDFKSAEAEAKKNKQGVWKTTEEKKPDRRPHWWGDEGEINESD